MDNSRLLLVLVFIAGCSGGGGDAEDSTVMPDAAAVRHVARFIAPAHDAGSAKPAAPGQAVLLPCPVVHGLFTPVYTPVSGNCGPILNPLAVQFDGGAHGVNTTIERGPNGTKTTEIVIEGCSVHLTLTVADAMGTKQVQVVGPQLSIASESQISGTVELAHFDASGQIACTGTYDATFSK